MNLGYHSARVQGQIIRTYYSKSISAFARRTIVQSTLIPVSVYSFSCEADLPEQVASIRSFIRHVGVPERFTVVSDGTHTSESTLILASIHPCVTVVRYEEVARRDLPEPIANFANVSPYGKKLAVAWSLPTTTPVIMADADILFFRGGNALAEIITNQETGAWYLTDAQPAFDSRMIKDLTEQKHPVNCGFMLLKEQLNWDNALQRLSCLNEAPIPFTEQTVVHFAMHDSNAQPLSRDKFVLKLDDQFIYTDRYALKEIALRHYVNPIRHKLWIKIPD